MSVMGALRLGTNLMRQEFTDMDKASGRPKTVNAIGADEDSIAMESQPKGKNARFTNLKSRTGKSPKNPKTQRPVF
ncbi:MAG: hypothetical protein R2860_14130 [Desulfobacterales bacterium]